MKKTYFKSILLIFIFGISLSSRSQIISTIAGNGIAGYSGDGGPATASELNLPVGVGTDLSGNVYVADYLNNRIRIISTTGIIITFAGNGIASYSGDGGPATAAELNNPYGIATDTSRNIYIADFNNNRIRLVNTSGIINTFAGNGIGGFSGDGGQATAAELSSPMGLAVDTSGNVYIADYGNNRIRIVNITGIINTFAGGGSGFGDGGPATSAQLHLPTSVTINKSGNLYIADMYHNRIRMVNTSGIINTYAGIGTMGYSGDGGQATAARFFDPDCVALDAFGNLYIADYHNQRIRVVNTLGIINTFAGNGGQGFYGDGGQATTAELDYPGGVALDASGNVYIADGDNARIRKVAFISTGIKELSLVSNEVNIYPSPTSGSFTITGVAPGQVIEIYNYVGQKLSTNITYKTTMQFDISNQADGIYLVRILNKDGSVVATKKVLKTD